MCDQPNIVIVILTYEHLSSLRPQCEVLFKKLVSIPW